MTDQEKAERLIHEDDYIAVYVTDKKGAGGAYHRYDVVNKETDEIIDSVKFQEGPIQENGVNGNTNEALLAIVVHRLECFNAGPFSHRMNAIAKTHTETAQLWLEKRTKDRKKRGVEGKNEA